MSSKMDHSQLDTDTKSADRSTTAAFSAAFDRSPAFTIEFAIAMEALGVRCFATTLYLTLFNFHAIVDQQAVPPHCKVCKAEEPLKSLIWLYLGRDFG